MKRVRLLAAAEQEMRDAISFYEQQARHLGRELHAAILSARRDVGKNPERWSALGPGVRRRLVHHFPYALVYRVEPEEVVVIAIMHLSRRPGYWHDRA